MYNLLDEDSIINLYNKTNIFKRIADIQEVITVFKIFSTLNIKNNLLIVDAAGELTLNEHDDFKRKISAIDIFYFATKLIKLSQCKGFQFLSVGLNNETQFCDTMFEVDCAHEIYNRPTTAYLEMSPQVSVKCKVKNPDFKFTRIDGVTVYCECKSMRSCHRASESMATRLIPLIEPHLTNFLTNRHRVEILFRVAPPHWNRNYSEQIVAAIKVLIENNFTQSSFDLKIGKYSTVIKLCSIEEPMFFKPNIVAANKPKHGKPTLIVGELNNLEKSVKVLIKDAITQLPEKEISAIFLQTINERDSMNAINDFFKNNNNYYLGTIFSWSDKLNPYLNPRGIYQIC